MEIEQQQSPNDNNHLNKTLESLQNEFIECFSSVPTKTTYNSHFKQLFDQKFLIKSMTLAEFAKQDTKKILDLIRQQSLTIKPAKKRRKNSKPTARLASDSIRQSRAAMFISFT